MRSHRKTHKGEYMEIRARPKGLIFLCNELKKRIERKGTDEAQV